MMTLVDPIFDRPSLDSISGFSSSENAPGEDNPIRHEREPGVEAAEDWCTLDSILTMGNADGVQEAVGQTPKPSSSGDSPAEPNDKQLTSRPTKPFQRWIRTLQKRAARRQGMLGGDGLLFEGESGETLAVKSAHRRHSSSGSSFGFVTAVNSASVSLADASVLTRSRINIVQSLRGQSRTDQSSRASFSATRLSEDSYRPDRQALLDPAVTARSLQRRRILGELIETEESYIADVRFLMNVYVTILASLPTSPACLRSSVNRNLTDIVELHEEILGELHRAVPDSEYTQLDIPFQQVQSNPPVRGHQRWRSLDVVPEGKNGVSWLHEEPGMLAEPQTAAEVAKIFLKRMNRFFIYEEYGAKYELMIKDVSMAYRTMPGWPSYQKGLEVLAASMGSANSNKSHARKSLSIADLLVKPIQRVCKYPLLFSELLKNTPVVDCPYSHMEIENTLIRLREATGEINRATDDPRIKAVLEKTWILQDRLAFPDQQLDAASKNRIRSFGHIQLCGALHVCWQTKEGVNGQYMVALLYRARLCLATACRVDQVYTIQACIALTDIKVEEVDNGRGLQCHTAQHSWKLVFISDHQLHELIMTACSPKEGMEWRTRLQNSQNAATAGQDEIQAEIFTFLSLNIRPLGTVFRKPGTIARKISIHRATTVGPKSPLCQVILKNTSVARETTASNHHGSQINRSQSLLTTNSRIPVLAPPRAERVRLEALLADVWTRDVLPFPGITARSRSEQLMRASASSVMRKLSVVSITSTFTRRSASFASLPQKERVGGGGDEEASRTAERTQMATLTAGYARHLQDGCTSPALSTVLSATTDQAEWPTSDSETRMDDDGDYFSTVRRYMDRKAATPEEIEEPSTPSSAKCRTTSRSQNESNNSVHVSPPLAEHSGPTADSWESPGPGLERGRSTPPVQASPRPNKLSGKLAKARAKHRAAVAQGIRSLFR